jgi:putative two-component system response regulator
VAVEHPDGVAPAVLEHSPDMILLDYMMPDRNGAEVVEELRADPETASTPVAYLTGRADVADGTTLEELGVVGVIEKPFDTTTLVPRLLTMLGS